MDVPFVGGAELRAALSMSDAIAILERALAIPIPTTPERSHHDVGEGDLLVMPSWGPGSVGVKLVTVAPGNPDAGLPLIQGVYVLFGKPELGPVAFFDGAALTALRTAAVSGVATRRLAAEDARRLLIFGAGVQAHAHLEAMFAVRPIGHVSVLSRSRDSALELVETARSFGSEAEIGTDDDLRTADIICTCTSSSRPLFDGRKVKDGVHINAVGSYKTSTRELDDAVFTDAQVVVDTPKAKTESGDLLSPIGGGILRGDEIEDLPTFVREEGGRRKRVTVFKSVGAAFEDLIVAQAAAERL